MDEHDGLIDRAIDLEQRIEVKGAGFDDLFSYTRRTRRLTRVAVALSVAVALLIVGLTFAVLRVRANTAQMARADDVATALAGNLRDRCELSNLNKAGEAELWRTILAVPPSTPRTAAQEGQIVAIEAVVGRIFAATDCSQLTAKP